MNPFFPHYLDLMKLKPAKLAQIQMVQNKQNPTHKKIKDHFQPTRPLPS